MSVSVPGLDPQEFDLTDLRRAWYNPRTGLTLNRQVKEQVVFLGDDPGVPKMSLVLPKLFGRDMFGCGGGLPHEGGGGAKSSVKV